MPILYSCDEYVTPPPQPPPTVPPPPIPDKASVGLYTPDVVNQDSADTKVQTAYKTAANVATTVLDSGNAMSRGLGNAALNSVENATPETRMGTSLAKGSTPFGVVGQIAKGIWDLIGSTPAAMPINAVIDTVKSIEHPESLGDVGLIKTATNMAIPNIPGITTSLVPGKHVGLMLDEKIGKAVNKVPTAGSISDALVMTEQSIPFLALGVPGAGSSVFQAAKAAIVPAALWYGNHNLRTWAKESAQGSVASAQEASRYNDLTQQMLDEQKRENELTDKARDTSAPSPPTTSAPPPVTNYDTTNYNTTNNGAGASPPPTSQDTSGSSSITDAIKSGIDSIKSASSAATSGITNAGQMWDTILGSGLDAAILSMGAGNGESNSPKGSSNPGGGSSRPSAPVKVVHTHKHKHKVIKPVHARSFPHEEKKLVRRAIQTGKE